MFVKVLIVTKNKNHYSFQSKFIMLQISFVATIAFENLAAVWRRKLLSDLLNAEQ